MSEIKVGDVVVVVDHDHAVEGTALREYPGYSNGSRHIVIGISHDIHGPIYKLVPVGVHFIGAYAPEIQKVDEL
nr:MAG TPA: histidine kinase-like protein [Caudoviricetes sp.]